MPPDAAANGLPLGPMQLGMLLQELKGESQSSRVEQLVCYLDEAVDLPALWQAWVILAGRHESLRAGFDLDQSLDRCQWFPDRVDLPWRLTDLSGAGPVRQEE